MSLSINDLRAHAARAPKPLTINNLSFATFLFFLFDFALKRDWMQGPWKLSLPILSKQLLTFLSVASQKELNSKHLIRWKLSRKLMKISKAGRFQCFGLFTKNDCFSCWLRAKNCLNLKTMKAQKGDLFTLTRTGVKSELVIQSDSIDGPKGKHFVFVSGVTGQTPVFFSVRKSQVKKKNGWKRFKEKFPIRTNVRIVCQNTFRISKIFDSKVNLKPSHS